MNITSSLVKTLAISFLITTTLSTVVLTQLLPSNDSFMTHLQQMAAQRKNSKVKTRRSSLISFLSKLLMNDSFVWPAFYKDIYNFKICKLAIVQPLSQQEKHYFIGVAYQWFYVG